MTQKKSMPNRKLITEVQSLVKDLNKFTFSSPVSSVYNPLEYAWEPHADYLSKYGTGSKKILFLGMNPGPFGMMQTGIPFGEIEAVKNWLRIEGTVYKPTDENPKRPIEGWDCKRSEVSGRRLWGLFKKRFHQPKDFFKDHFVANYCPLGFLSETGSNLTPDKIPAKEFNPVVDLCDQHLRSICSILKVEIAVGLGTFAEKRLQKSLNDSGIQIYRILHPSPASPAANKDWEGKVTKQMESFGLWE